MTTPHDGCACSHEQPATDTSLPMVGSTVATDAPADHDGCRGGGGGGGGGGCCGGHAA